MNERLFLLLIPFLLFAYGDDRGLKLKQMQEEARTALVVGIDHYKSLNDLKNPVNDSRAMRDVLRRRGFEVIYLENADRREFDRKVKAFTSKLRDGGVGLFYFAGHGIQVDGDNYLVAKDSDLSDKDDVKYDTIALNEVTQRMRNANNRVNILILDACRNDPFSRGSGGGLAPLKNARGMFVAYATEAGSVAQDGRGKNGVFTKHLIRHMDEPVKIEEVFKRTRRDVATETDHQQFPGVYNQLYGDFYFTLPDMSVKKSSPYGFSSVTPDTFSLTIKPIPSDAKVQITNITPRYHDGIKLKKGSYTIKVSKAGYLSKQGSVELSSDLTIPVTLEKDSIPAFTPIKATPSTALQTTSIEKGRWDPAIYRGKRSYSRNTSGTVKDNYTGLTWQKGYSINSKSWENAKTYCQDLHLDGYSDWRLPTFKELYYLADRSKYSPSIDTDYFGQIEKWYWWSTTEYKDDASLAWGVHFYDGLGFKNPKSDEYYVRCVRIGQ